MKIEFERQGGFAAIPLRWKGDSSQLESHQERDLLDMVEEAEFFNLPDQLPGRGPSPDRFSYKITIEDSARKHTLMAAESALNEPLQKLIQQITALARIRR